jgi:predicted acylesterase/phospholipase RssA/CRP-like cAMP-binding protein
MAETDSIYEATWQALEAHFGLAPDDSKFLASQLDIVSLHGGEVLLRQGDPGDSLFLLVRGRLEVWLDLQSPVYIGQVLPGETVGEAGMLIGEPRSASVRAIRHSVLVKLGRQDFERLALKYPSMIMNLASNVAKRLHQNTTGANRGKRPSLKVLCLRPLDKSDRLDSAVNNMLDALSRHGTLIHLSIEKMALMDVDEAPVHADMPLTEQFHRWINLQEENYRFIVLECEPGNSHWSRFAESQSDLILMLAGSDTDASLREFESPAASSVPHMLHKVLVLLHPAQEIAGTQRWLENRKLDYHLHIRADHAGDYARVGRVLAGVANGLVLGGGAARGFAHIGVYQALYEAGVPVDWIGGSSIGAVMGVSIALYVEPALVINKVRAAFVEGKPFGDYTLPVVSLLSGKRMYSLSREFMPGNIEDLAIPFFAVSSNINTGEINLHESGPIWRAISASAALPGLMPPMVFNKSLAIDGAVLNNLPVDLMAKKPIGNVLAVQLSSKDHEPVNFDEIPSAWQLIAARLSPFRANGGVPGLATLLFKATEVANRKRTEELARGADVLFKPPVSEFSLLKVNRFEQIVQVGYVHGQAIIEDQLT